MSDVVVTVPKSFGLDTWIAEGDSAGDLEAENVWKARRFFVSRFLDRFCPRQNDGGMPPLSWGEAPDLLLDQKLLAAIPEIFWNYSIGRRADIEPGERVYVWYGRNLRGYAPLVAQQQLPRWSLVRGGGAVAVTIDEERPGWRGPRKRWWERSQERPFPEWRTP